MQRSDKNAETWTQFNARIEARRQACEKLRKDNPLALDAEELDNLVEALSTIAGKASAVRAIALRQVRLSRDLNGFSAPRDVAPMPLNVSACESYWTASKALVDALMVVEPELLKEDRMGFAGDFSFKMVPAVHAVKANIDVLSTYCDEEHGDPRDWLARFSSVADEMSRLTTVRDEQVVVGECPFDGGVVHAVPGEASGRCCLCWRPIPVDVASNVLLAKVARAGVWKTQMDTSRLLQLGGVRVPQSTIASWIRRGKLESDEHGRVRFADVLNLAIGA